MSLLDFLSHTFPNELDKIFFVRTAAGMFHGKLKRHDDVAIALESGKGTTVIPLHAIVAISDKREVLDSAVYDVPAAR
jgi:hypothetical protein